MSTAAHPTAAPPAGELIRQQPQANSLSFWDRISSPIEAAERMGKWFYDSKMLGCTMPSQGQVLAFGCLALRKTPFEIVATYHIIGGRLSMRSDAMLAGFHKIGGKHRILRRDPEEASVELTFDGQSVVFSFSWEEALQEPFVYAKDGKTLKDNYATPRARMQMLWARVISDGINALRPEISAGLYPPEVMADITSTVYVPSEQIVDAEFTVSTDAESPAAATGAQPAATGRPQVRDTGGVSAIVSEQTAKAAATSPSTTTAAATDAAVPTGGDAKCSKGQLLEVKKYKDLLGYGDDKWKPILDKLGVASARDLTIDGCVRLIGFLQKKYRDMPKSPEKQDELRRDEMSQWADGALASKPGTSVAAATATPATGAPAGN